MAVIADFPSYPEWVDSMKTAEVLTVAPDGRAETVRMVLDHTLVKDDYVLAYEWRRNAVSWKLIRGNLLKAMDGTYALRPTPTGTNVTYTLESGRQHAHDRHVSAQGREDDHRRCPQRAEEASRRLTAVPDDAGLLGIGVDIGGTKVAAGVVDETGRILERRQTPTPTQSPQAAEDTIVDLVTELRRRLPEVRSVGIGAAGWVDNRQAVVAFSPHLAWRNEPLKEQLAKRIDLPLIVDNDANAAAWAEYRFGAGQGSSVLVCLTLGTGIGGGLVINGQLFRGTYGMAGEWGHMISVPGGHRCECGNRGCWEQYASGNALVREARELARSNSPMAYRLLEMLGGDPDAITGPGVTEAALKGETTAIELLGDVGTWLGEGIANLAAALDPDLFVIGGGVSAAGDLLLQPARIAFARTLTGRGFRIKARIELARFRNDAGLIGAADLARVAMVEPPRSSRPGFWPQAEESLLPPAGADDGARARPRRRRRADDAEGAG